MVAPPLPIEQRHARELDELESRARAYVAAARANGGRGKKAQAAIEAAEREMEKEAYELNERQRAELEDVTPAHLEHAEVTTAKADACETEGKQQKAERAESKKSGALKKRRARAHVREHDSGAAAEAVEVQRFEAEQVAHWLGCAERLQILEALDVVAEEEVPDLVKAASSQVRLDRELLLAACEHHHDALRVADKSLKAERNFMLEAIRRNGESFMHACVGLRSEKDFALAAIHCAQENQVRDLCGCFPDAIRSDKEIALAAVSSTSLSHVHMVFRRFPENIRFDCEVAMAAVSKRGAAFEFASPHHRSDRAFILRVLASTRGRELFDVVELLPESLRGDQEIVYAAIAAVRSYGELLKVILGAPQAVRSDSGIMLAAVAVNHAIVKFASDNLLTRKSFVAGAVKIDGRVLKYVHADLQRDESIVLAAIKQNPSLLRYAGKRDLASACILREAAETGQSQALDSCEHVDEARAMSQASSSAAVSYPVS